jgi:hypothetical protein
MKDPSFCYKFYWLEAIVQLITEGKHEASYNDIIDEMIASAWFSVLEFHVHLSWIYGDGQIRDNLEKAVLRLHDLSKLSNNASNIEIKNLIKKFDDDVDLHTRKMELTKNVPIKALSGFANRGSEQISLDCSVGKMMAYYNHLNETSLLLPYTFGADNGLKRVIHFHNGWIQMIQDNAVAIKGWIQFEKVKWLQNNNPELPGLVYKLVPSDEKIRKLTHVRNLWKVILEMHPVVDVFKNKPIDIDSYAVDHFIPWTFVMNDELWNLMPMDSSLNSSKSNKLPLWDPFFERFAYNQYSMYEMIYGKDSVHKLYEACYRDNLHSIWANQELYRRGNSKDEFYNILEKNMRPVYDSARRQGYDVWNMNML